MGAEIQPYAPVLPEDPARLPYAGLVAAWHEIDSRSAWFRARLAAAVPRGKLRQYAADVDVAYGTVLEYRSVAEKYPPELGRPNVSFGVAKALMAQDDRFELVSREKPWTVDEARQFAAERARTALPPAKRRPGRPRKPPAAQPSLTNAELARSPSGSPSAPGGKAEPGSSSPAPGPASPVSPAVPVTGSKPDPVPGPAPCPGCTALRAQLEQAQAEITRLRAAHPDVVMAAELKAVTEQRDVLAARVTGLEGKLSEATDSAEQDEPYADPEPEPEAASGELETGETDSDPDARRPCGSVHAGKVVIIAGGQRQRIRSPEGEEMEWLCAGHQQVLAEATGAQVIPAPGSGDPLSFDVGTCQFPVPAALAEVSG